MLYLWLSKKKLTQKIICLLAGRAKVCLKNNYGKCFNFGFFEQHPMHNTKKKSPAPTNS